MFSSFWILANNSWMQVPLGHAIVDGRIVPTDWREIVLGPIQMVRWPHMLLAAFLTTGMCVAATGAWYVLRGVHSAQARVMLHWGLGLVTVMIPIQLFFGHVTGLYVLKHQPANFAAIEARWKTQQSASEVLLAIPDEKNERNLFAIEIPKLFSLACYVLVLARSNWQTRPWGLAFPAIGVLALVGIFFGARQKRDGWPFAMTTLLFVAAFLSLGVMLWPYMIPYSITVADAAAPEASLRFLFYGGVVVLPVIAAYTIGVYWVFRGKVRKGYGQMTVGRS
jgi:cytochrome bd-type quinol oxidase subunit 2